MRTNKAKVIILTPEDLLISNQGKSIESVTIADFSGMSIKNSKDADVVIFIDEAKVKKIIVFNDALVEDEVYLEN